jgi:pimeloyl-ACP methyl ester carboxylesterase
MTILLHGFWGQPSDWNAVIQRLPLGQPVVAPDLYAAGELGPRFPLRDWGQNFWRWIDETFGDDAIQLVGYSMGARLAVTAAMIQPQRVKRALFLSGNPLKPGPEREAWEDEWSEKFLRLEWPILEAMWQDQDVFGKTTGLARRKTPEMREILGLSLRHWSPRLHPFSAAEVAALPAAMEWAFGASDQKYLEVAKSLQELAVKGQISIIPQAGHRLLVDGADFVSQWIALPETPWERDHERRIYRTQVHRKPDNLRA